MGLTMLMMMISLYKERTNILIFVSDENDDWVTPSYKARKHDLYRLGNVAHKGDEEVCNILTNARESIWA